MILKRGLLFTTLFALVLVLSLTLFAAPNDIIWVTVTDHTFAINDYQLDLKKSAYPFFLYNEIIYMPLTYEFTYPLALSVSFDERTGISITNVEEQEYQPYEQNKDTLASLQPGEWLGGNGGSIRGLYQ